MIDLTRRELLIAGAIGSMSLSLRSLVPRSVAADQGAPATSEPPAYTDYRDGRHKVMALAAEELLRRFLLHVSPKGLMRIRHFGFLANRCRQQPLGEIRAAIDAAPAQDTERAGVGRRMGHIAAHALARERIVPVFFVAHQPTPSVRNDIFSKSG